MLEVTRGRGSPLERWPAGCCGRGGALEICTALVGSDHQCMLCQRCGDFPLPATWPGDLEAEALVKPSAQAVRTSLPSLPWAVLVLLEHRFVDPRWPIIGTRSPREAVELTLARGAQVWRASKLEPSGPGTWRAGRGVVLATHAFALSERAGQ